LRPAAPLVALVDAQPPTARSLGNSPLWVLYFDRWAHRWALRYRRLNLGTTGFWLARRIVRRLVADRTECPWMSLARDMGTWETFREVTLRAFERWFGSRRCDWPSLTTLNYAADITSRARHGHAWLN